MPKIDLTAFLPEPLKPYAKAVYVALTLAAYLVAEGLVTGHAAEVVTKVIGFLTVLAAVYAPENRETASVDPKDELESPGH